MRGRYFGIHVHDARILAARNGRELRRRGAHDLGHLLAARHGQVAAGIAGAAAEPGPLVAPRRLADPAAG